MHLTPLHAFLFLGPCYLLLNLCSKTDLWDSSSKTNSFVKPFIVIFIASHAFQFEFVPDKCCRCGRFWKPEGREVWYLQNPDKKKKRVSMCASSCQFTLSYFLALELLLRDQQTRERTESSKVELFNNLSLNTSTSCFSSVSSLTANT